MTTHHANDRTEALQNTVRQAIDSTTPLIIQGHRSKSFLCDVTSSAEVIDMTQHHGIISYEPDELVITARAGTSLSTVQTILAETNQQLPFEPPQFNQTGSLGGAVASGLSGPSRPWQGAVRDHILGCRILNGKGEVLKFGGEVMKNVAGFDVSRLMCGAYGTLGILLDVSVKVLPQPQTEATCQIPCTAEQAMAQLKSWAARPWPITGASWYQDHLYLRFSGAQTAVEHALDSLSAKAVDTLFWQQLRDQTLPLFQQDTQPLWRISCQPHAALEGYTDNLLLDWGGAQRWLSTDQSHHEIIQLAEQAGGHAQLIRYPQENQLRHHPVTPVQKRLQEDIRRAFDPRGIFNAPYIDLVQ